MSLQTWEECLNVNVADGTAVTAAALTVLVPDITIPANYMYSGRVLRQTVYAKLTSTGTPGTMTISSYWGGTGGVLLAVSGTITVGTSITNGTYRIELTHTCRTVGSSGSILTTGVAFFGTAATAAIFLLPNTAPAATTVDTTAAKALTVAITPSVATGSHTGIQHTIEALT